MQTNGQLRFILLMEGFCIEIKRVIIFKTYFSQIDLKILVFSCLGTQAPTFSSLKPSFVCLKFVKMFRGTECRVGKFLIFHTNRQKAIWNKPKYVKRGGKSVRSCKAALQEESSLQRKKKGKGRRRKMKRKVKKEMERRNKRK